MHNVQNCDSYTRTSSTYIFTCILPPVTCQCRAGCRGRMRYFRDFPQLFKSQAMIVYETAALSLHIISDSLLINLRIIRWYAFGDIDSAFSCSK
jgi:hypothetical protein